MKIKNQVCSLELAKQLKELGFNQDSLFCWIEFPDGKTTVQYIEILRNKNAWANTYAIRKGIYSAFTVAELGEILPKKVNWKMLYYKDVWNLDFGDYRVGEKTEADARASMLIYLLKNKLITL